MNYVIAMQPGQLGKGMEYDPTEPLGYPYAVNEEGRVNPGPHTEFEEYVLLGFQTFANVQKISLTRAEFLDDPKKAEGMYPVFSSEKDGVFNMMVPILHVHDFREVCKEEEE